MVPRSAKLSPGPAFWIATVTRAAGPASVWTSTIAVEPVRFGTTRSGSIVASKSGCAR